MKGQPEIPLEKPLDGGGKFLLTLRATLLIFVYYAFALTSIIFLTLWIAGEASLAVFVAWFARSVSLRRSVREHFAALKALLRSFRLEKSADVRIRLSPDDAPEVFRLIERLCLQTQTAFPSDVLLEMQLNAWVRLKGWRRGGKMALGIGFDLIAGLSVRELETVIAHELTHAKLTERASRDWLANGLERAVKLTRLLTRRSREKLSASAFRRMLLSIAESLAESAAKWKAAVFRQEEFEADRGAAEICGVARSRQALIKIESLSRFAAQIQWRERVAHLQTHNIAPWLVDELAAVKPMDMLEISAQIPDRFSTHPTLRERLNALGANNQQLNELEDRPAIDLLTDADALAEKLMSRIEQVHSEQEERDTKSLRRLAREMREAGDINLAQKFGACIVIASEIAGAVAWIAIASAPTLVAIFGAAILGLLVYWLGRMQEGFAVPIPDFGLLKNTWATDREATEARIEAVREELRARFKSRKDSGMPALLEMSLQSLAECNYLKAGVAAELFLENSPTAVQPALVAAIASAWLGRGPEMLRALAIVQKHQGLRSEATCWGVAWTYMMRGNWGRAEALLDQVIDKRPDNPTLLNLRALCQSRRGKIQSAIISVRRACLPQPRNPEHAKFLIDLLLEGGYLREAQQRLGPMDKVIRYDNELALIAVRLNLLLCQFDIADRWAATLVSSGAPPFMIVRLAAAFELSRRFDDAANYYRKALAEAFYPDACLGLARLEAEKHNLAGSRQNALDALNLNRALGEYATPPLDLLGPILNQLSALEPPTRFFKAWTGTLPAVTSPSVVAGKSFVVYALDQPQAERYLQKILAAMSKGVLHLSPGNIQWRLSPPEVQPFGMARPGVQPLEDGQRAHVFRGFNRQRIWQPHFVEAQVTATGAVSSHPILAIA
ncbi:MAG TPA: M48 family metalloprotease [Verrucomicrobiae bacterium]|jgi:Zn-dependent protease with chaperone function/Tfp pilus assembly protein PilF